MELQERHSRIDQLRSCRWMHGEVRAAGDTRILRFSAGTGQADWLLAAAADRRLGCRSPPGPHRPRRSAGLAALEALMINRSIPSSVNAPCGRWSALSVASDAQFASPCFGPQLVCNNRQWKFGSSGVDGRRLYQICVVRVRSVCQYGPSNGERLSKWFCSRIDIDLSYCASVLITSGVVRIVTASRRQLRTVTAIMAQPGRQVLVEHLSLLCRCGYPVHSGGELQL